MYCASTKWVLANKTINKSVDLIIVFMDQISLLEFDINTGPQAYGIRFSIRIIKACFVNITDIACVYGFE